MPNQILSEQVEGTRWLNYILIIAAIVIITAHTQGITAKQSIDNQEIVATIFGLALIMAIFFIFRNIKITLNEQSLWFGYWKFGKQINLSDIAKLECRDYSWRRFHGLGIRYGIDRIWGYINRSGPGLYIETRTGKRYFVSSNRSEQWKAMITTQQKQNQRHGV